MTTIKADSGREENNNRMTFCGGYGGQRANNVSSGSPSEDSMGPRETIDCGRPLPKDNDLYASAKGADNKFNDNELNPILANRPNNINGMTNNSLMGGSRKISSISKDGSSEAIDADRPLNNNSITAMTSSDASAISIDENKERNSDGCFGGQTYAYLTISGTPDSPIPSFTDGGCGCWVSTNADLTLIAGAIGGLSALIQKIPYFSKARVLGRWNTQMDKILTKLNLGGAANFKEAYELMIKHKNAVFNKSARNATKEAIKKQLRKGIKNADGTLSYPRRTVIMPDGSEQVRDILPSHHGRGKITIKVPKGPGGGGFIFKRVTPEQIYEEVAAQRYKTFLQRTQKYFNDMEEIKVMQGFGPALQAKMQANLALLIQEYTGCFLGTVIGTAIVALDAVTVWRAKVCLGQGMSLDENCQCVCAEGWETACGNVSSSVWSNYANEVNSFFGGYSDYGGVAAIIFQGDEIQHCSLGCCSGQTQINNDDGTCDCQDPDAPSVFIQGNIYSTTGCDCRKKVSSNITGIPPAVIPGIYMDGDVKTQMENVGKIFNFDKCVFECPAGSDVALGKTKPALARYNDNLDDASVPTKEHYLYQTGCNFVCDGRDYVGTWPPTCDAGSLWNGDTLVCACVYTGACTAKHQTNGGSEGGVSDNPCGGAPDCYNNKTQQECDAIAAEQGRTFTFHIGETCTGCCNEYFFSGVAVSVSTSSGCDTSSAGYGGVFSQKCCWDGGANPDDFTCCGDPQCSSDYQAGCDECGQPDC